MRRLLPALTAAALIGTATYAIADHPGPNFSANGPLASGLNAGSGHPTDDFRGAVKWELIESFPTGNPHTDLDFFEQGGNIYGSFGTLAIGPNTGGQTILKLTEGNEVSPSFVASIPTAQCISDPNAALGLQHDVEAAPKGDTLSNSGFAVDRRDAQIVIDATDQRGRCHDQGTLGLASAPRGGLEIIDITDIANPTEIGLTSHIGEAHTVSVDPKRPHIAYAVSSDSVNTFTNNNNTPDNPDDDFLQRNNERMEAPNQAGVMQPNAQRFNLDGFEVVDMSSCMNFAPGTTVEVKREKCRPQVYRYRYPTLDMSLGHTLTGSVYGCHELEVYADDRLTCGSGAALMTFDMKGAFDDAGTPDDYSDDKPRGTPLGCFVRPSSSVGPFATGAMVTDCVMGGAEGKDELSIPNWIDSGSPSLTGVKYLGSIYHAGRAATAQSPPYDSTQDIDFDHEAEFSQSRRFLFATDERGGGVVAPGATCSPGADVKLGNGGLHAYQTSKLTTTRPKSAEEAQQAYATNSKGERAIFRVPIRTQTEGTFCTAHVFQQIPGQNRIFMGWYTQGTQVIDYVENADGTIEFINSGYFIPENANTWVSHIFKVEAGENGMFTYYGAAADFNLGAAGRNSIDIYKVTMPSPPKPLTSTGNVASLSLDVNVAEITAGNTPELSGVARDAAGKPVANVPVQLLAKQYNTTSYQPFRQVTTDANGRFRALVLPQKQTAYGVNVGRVNSPTKVVRVHTRMNIASPRAGQTVGNPVTVSGNLAPTFAGGAVGLAERLPDGRFRYISQANSNSDGTYRVSGRFTRGTHVLVVYTSARNGNLFGSKSITVNVS